MSMQDTLADMFTRIRNAQMARKSDVVMPASTQKQAIAKVLQDEGYVLSSNVSDGAKPELTIELKYFDGKPVIETIKRISSPGLRVYKNANDIPRAKDGLGIIVVSTNQGVLTDRAARKANVGGELLCEVS